MLQIETDGSIKLTRGDTARLTITIEDMIANEPYIIEENDTLTLTIKKTVKDKDALLTKQIKGSNVFSILPSDTKYMDFGKYKYDVQLEKENGDVYTIIEPSSFRLLPEVTY